MDPAWAWRTLGLEPGAPAAEVRRAFRVAAQLMHPDRVADLGDEVRAEAHRRMVELAEAYRTCLGSAGPTIAVAEDTGLLPSAGEQARELLDAARADLAAVDTWERARAVVTTLEHVAQAWPGTAEGEEARALLVTSVAATMALSTRERAGHLVRLADRDARDRAWESLWGRDELAIAQVVYGHPTADDEARRTARTRLVELEDWASLATDADHDVRRVAHAHLLLQEARALVERATWLSRRERAAFDEDFARWRQRHAALGRLSEELGDELAHAERRIVNARARERLKA
ncbi:MAG TPA: J domain-containing protein [Mycobacteriales bacterium]|jgi:uncharacterized protein YukE